MRDFSDAIRNLYESLILRDLLSYIIPGAMVLSAAFLPFMKETNLYDRIIGLAVIYGKLHWIGYLFLLGASYIIGFAVQSLGSFTGKIVFCPPGIECWKIRERLKLLFGRGSWKSDMHEYWVYKYYQDMRKFWEEAKNDEGLRRGRERLVVHKQMSGNFVAASILSSVIIISTLITIPGCSIREGDNVTSVVLTPWLPVGHIWAYLIDAILAIILTVSLFWGHRFYVLDQNAREQVAIENYHRKSLGFK